MNKNVIYILDCQFEDEWHKKEYAVKNITANKENLEDSYIKEIIDSGWPQDNQEEWTSVSIPRIQRYAEIHNADFYCFDSSWLEKMEMPETFFQYQRAVFLKYLILKEFEKSPYERMLFLDLDILIRDFEENIFEELGPEGIFMAPDWNAGNLHACKEKLSKYLNFQRDLQPLIPEEFARDVSETISAGVELLMESLVDKGIYGSHLPDAKLIVSNIEKEWKTNRIIDPPKNWFTHQTVYNWGVFLADKLAVSKLNSVVPDNDNWCDFFTYHGLNDNPKCETNGTAIMEQDLLPYFLNKSDTKVNLLPRKWNYDPCSSWETDSENKNLKINFGHIYDKPLIKLFGNKRRINGLSEFHKSFDYGE